MVRVRVVAAQDLVSQWPQIGFDATQIVWRNQVPVRIVSAAVGRGHQSQHFLHLACSAHQNSATFSRVGSFTLSPDLVYQHGVDT
jgi:hypothetical protein